MDASFCTWNAKENILQYAGANNSIYIIRNNKKGEVIVNNEHIPPKIKNDTNSLFEVNADRQPVGVYIGGVSPFTNNEVKLEKDDAVYLYSDGYPDQFGGKEGKKFKTANFKKLLLSIYGNPMLEQKEALKQTLEDWMKGYEQIDDICIIGTVLK